MAGQRNAHFTHEWRLPEPAKWMNVEGSRSLFKKAYLMEFCDSGGNTENVFAFSVPPENEEFTYGQRKTETKVFGGLHVDEYGADEVKIYLSGSTINQELKLVYQNRGLGEDSWLSGEAEIFLLRDLILKYKTLEALQKRPRIYLYDLSKHKDGSGSKCVWQVFQGEFKITRSSDRPFTYKYSIEFTGTAPGREKSILKVQEFPPEAPRKEVAEPLDRLQGAISFVDGAAAAANRVFAEARHASVLINTAGNLAKHAAATATGIVGSAGRTAAGFVNAAANAVEGANAVLNLPRALQLGVLSAGLDVQNATRRLVRATDDFGRLCRGAMSPETYRVPQEVLDQFGMSCEEFKDAAFLRLIAAENSANELAAAAKSGDVPDAVFGNPDPATGEQRVVLSYGSSEVRLSSTDTLESLAARHLGDPDKAVDIAAFNGIASLDELELGAAVKIPVYRRPPNSGGRNRIYAKREDRDNYGRDILLSEEGSMGASASGDWALSCGAANLAQAVLLRLKESAARRMRLTSYGIRASVADPVAGTAYILSSVDMTVNADPRVSSVRDIRFRAAGDALHVTVFYDDINKTQGAAAGSL